jgi:hypothetical protein
MKSPASALTPGPVGLELDPWLVPAESTATMPETSETTIVPLSLAFIEAVMVVGPDVPVEEKPTHTSAVPLPDWA